LQIILQVFFPRHAVLKIGKNIAWIFQLGHIQSYEEFRPLKHKRYYLMEHKLALIIKWYAKGVTFLLSK